MSIFFTSVIEGLELARKMHRNKEEIVSVLDTIAEDLKNATSGKVELFISEDTTTGGEQYRAVYGRYRSLVYIAPASRDGVERFLAFWRDDQDNGYPCTLERHGEKWVCSTPEEIISAFSELFRQPHVGLQVLDLVNLDLS